VSTLLAPFREIPVDRTVAERAGRIRRESGIRLPDALIAATAIEHKSGSRHPESIRLRAGTEPPPEGPVDALVAGEPISVTRRGRRVAVIIDSDAFDRLVEIADDVDDRRELDAARADDDYVPWADVKAMLGLD
jgi:prevent-host-death family protein